MITVLSPVVAPSFGSIIVTAGATVSARTVSVVEPIFPPEVAFMVAVPCPVVFIRPFVAVSAAPAPPTDHTAVAVRSSVLPSDLTPVALN